MIMINNTMLEVRKIKDKVEQEEKGNAKDI